MHFKYTNTFNSFVTQTSHTTSLGVGNYYCLNFVDKKLRSWKGGSVLQLISHTLVPEYPFLNTSLYCLCYLYSSLDFLWKFHVWFYEISPPIYNISCWAKSRSLRAFRAALGPPIGSHKSKDPPCRRHGI